MQTQLLAQHPSDQLRVYTVWLPMLAGDARQAWDVYYLSGPNAEWETIPSPLVSSGGTMYSERQALKVQLRTLLEK